MKNKEFNYHHLYPESRGGLTNDTNLKYMEVKEHSNFHRVFGNMTPTEQICKILLMNEKIFTDNFKADLLNLLSNYVNYYYTKKVRKGYDKKEVKTVDNLIDILCYD